MLPREPSSKRINSHEKPKVRVRNCYEDDIEGSAAEIVSLYSQQQIDVIEKKVADMLMLSGDILIFLKTTHQSRDITILSSMFSLPQYETLASPETCLGIIDVQLKALIDKQRHFEYFVSKSVCAPHQKQKDLLIKQYGEYADSLERARELYVLK
jgi:hypothetical protein